MLMHIVWQANIAKQNSPSSKSIHLKAEGAKTKTGRKPLFYHGELVCNLPFLSCLQSYFLPCAVVFFIMSDNAFFYRVAKRLF